MRLLGEVVLAILLAGFLLYVVQKWVLGCGEYYIDSEGTKHLIRCD
jgi:hypothetical protein